MNTFGRDLGFGKRLRPSEMPRGPWVASSQYGMHFILSQDNEVLIRADWMPIELLEAMADMANRWIENENIGGD